MDHSVRVRASFDASHHVEHRVRCQRQHGHHWTIEAERASGRDLPSDEADDLAAQLELIVAEWRNRDLNEMIHNFNETTPERLAPWIMERLLATTQQLTMVSLTDGIITATVTRTPLR